MRALRTRFGLMAEEASDHLQIIKRDWRTPLEDHANEVERLAQAAFGHAAGGDRRLLVYNAFFRTVNDPDLQWYWLAAKVSNIREALKMGKASFQMEGPRGASYTARQVVKDDEETTPLPNPQAAAATTKSPEPTQLTLLISMVKGLQATVIEVQSNQVDR